jgi:MFS family permease
MNTPMGNRNVLLLAGCQAMLLSISPTVIALGGLAGLALAPNKALATLAVSFWVLGGLLATYPASLHMQRVGRQRGLIDGALVGIGAALLSAAALWLHSFWLLCLGALLFGAQHAFGQYYRFAAADGAAEGTKSTAISLVLAGGMVGGILGPGTSRYTIDLLEPRYTGAFLSLIAFALVSVLLLRFARLPKHVADERVAAGRRLVDIVRQPKFIVAALSGAIGNSVMLFLMTATPIAMSHSGHPYGDAAMVISWHVVGMFAPALFTGALIRRLGALRVIMAGALVNALALAVALSGTEVAHFWWSLVLDGVGWNFLFVGGTALLTEAYRPEERARAQGINDLSMFTLTAIASFSSGVVMTTSGWRAVNLAALPFIGVALAAVWWLLRKPRVRAAKALSV